MMRTQLAAVRLLQDMGYNRQEVMCSKILADLGERCPPEVTPDAMVQLFLDAMAGHAVLY